MHRVVLVLVIVLVILMFLGCLDMHIHTRPRASSFVPEEASIDLHPESGHEVVPVQHPVSRGDNGWMVVVIEGDELTAGAEAAAADR